MLTVRPETGASGGGASGREASPSPHERIYDILADGFFIRLLTLPPGEPTDPISVTLTTVELDDAPPFAALSYVWGRVESRGDLVPITCNGHRFDVTPNLAAALRRIRLREEPRLVWADAVCINQRDMDERAHHVSFMGRIYSRADIVLVHLGPAPDGGADDAAALVAEVKGILAQYGGDIAKAPILTPSDPFLSDSRWASMESLLSVPWFTRAWVIQEVGLARDPVVLYDNHGDGGVEFLYRDLLRLAAWHERCAPTLTSRWGVEFSGIHSDWLDWAVAGADAWNGHLDRTFLNLVNQASWLGCADHRDHIYSLLGHPLALVDAIEEDRDGGIGSSRTQPTDRSAVTEMGEKKLIVTPDYRKSVEDVYFELATELMRQPRPLRALSAVEHASDADIDNESDAPSWVLMWMQFMTIYTMGIFSGFYYNASGGLDEQSLATVTQAAPSAASADRQASLLQAERLLRVDVVFLDAVDKVITFDNKHFELPWTAADSPGLLRDTMQRIWHATVEPSSSPKGCPLYSGRHNATSNSDGRIDALSLTLTCGLTGYDPAESPEHIAEHRANFRAYRTVSGLGGTYTWSELDRESGLGTVDADAAASSSASSGDAEKFWLEMRFMSFGRSFFVTKKGYFGLGPRIVRPGDRCAVLLGAKVPFVLRSGTRTRDGEEQWRLVGECYMHGVMHGEAAELCRGGAAEIEDIWIR